MKTVNKCWIFALIILLAVAAVVLVTASSNNRGDMASEMIANEKEWKVGRMDEIIKKSRKVPLEELPVYSFEEISYYVGGRGMVMHFNSVSPLLEWFNSTAKKSADSILKVDDDHIAVLYAVSDEEHEKAIAAVIFRRSISKKEDGNGEYETWIKTGEMYMLNDIHGFDDYVGILPGTPVSDLYLIDGSVRYDVLRREYTSDDIEKYANGEKGDGAENYPTRMIYKLLDRGIMTVEYDLGK